MKTPTSSDIIVVVQSLISLLTLTIVHSGPAIVGRNRVQIITGGGRQVIRDFRQLWTSVNQNAMPIRSVIFNSPTQRYAINGNNQYATNPVQHCRDCKKRCPGDGARFNSVDRNCPTLVPCPDGSLPECQRPIIPKDPPFFQQPRARSTSSTYDPATGAMTIEEAMSNFHDLTQMDVLKRKPLVNHVWKEGSAEGEEVEVEAMSMSSTHSNFPTDSQRGPQGPASFTGPASLTGVPIPLRGHNPPPETSNKNETKCVGNCAACTQNVLRRFEAAIGESSGEFRSEIEQMIRATERNTNVTRIGEQTNYPTPVATETFGFAPEQFASLSTAARNPSMGSSFAGVAGLSMPEGVRLDGDVEGQEETLLGQTIRMGCPYTRGNQLEDGSGYSGLCSLCWAWRVLPTGFSPRIVNEIMCNDKDGSCLNNFGKCRKRYMPMTVYFAEEGIREPMKRTINTLVSCECQVKEESRLFDFIAARIDG